MEVAEGLVRLVQSALEDPRVMLVPPDLPGLRVMLVNADLLDQKALGVFRVPLDLLEAELEEPLFPDPKDLGGLPALLDQRGSRAFRVLLGLRGIMAFLVPLEQTDNQALRVRMVQLDPLALLDPRVLPDLLESVALPVRMR